MSGASPGIVLDISDLQAVYDANKRLLDSLLKVGNASIKTSKDNGLNPIQSYRFDMRPGSGLPGTSVNNPYKIGPHKSILYRSVVSGNPGSETVFTFNPNNDIAYYRANSKDPDISNWTQLQVGKSLEFDEPVTEGWLYFPNPLGTQVYAVLETSVVGYVRSYQMQGNAVSTTDGSHLYPGAVTVATTAGGTQILAANSNTKSVTLYNAGASTVWLGGLANDPLALETPAANTGIPLLAGAIITIKNSGNISGIAVGASSLVTFIQEI